MYNKEEFKNTIAVFEEKKAKKLNLPVLLRLVGKLDEEGLKDEEILSAFSEMQVCLKDIHKGDNFQTKIFKNTQRQLMSQVSKKYNLVAKVTYMGMCIGIGLAIGAAIGAAMEKKADEEGRLY